MKKYVNDESIEQWYEACPDVDKKDYSLVKRLVLKYNDNTDFITKVADYYLDNADTDLEKIELGIIMERILPQSLSEKYRAMNEAVYSKERIEIEMVKKNCKLL